MTATREKPTALEILFPVPLCLRNIMERTDLGANAGIRGDSMAYISTKTTDANTLHLDYDINTEDGVRNDKKKEKRNNKETETQRAKKIERKARIKLSFVLNYAPRHADEGGSGNIAPRIFHLDNRTSVVGLTLRPLYCQYELDWSELHGRLNYV
jgi:hypothetical protein